MPIPPSADVFLDFGNASCFVNGGTAVNDLSGNGKNWTLNNTSYTYDGTVGAVTLPPGTYADGNNTQYGYGTAAFTILTWLKLDPVTSSSANICIFGPDGSGTRLWYFLNGNNGACSDTGSSAIVFGGSTFDGNWHLVALTRPANGQADDQVFYIDGASIPITATLAPGTNLNLGNGGYATIHTTFNPDPITISTFKIYMAELTAGEILSIYTAEAGRYTGGPTPYVGKSNGRSFGQGFSQ